MSEWKRDPAASPESKSKPAAKKCPNCGRALLTQTSALCNWCGAKIEDEEYQRHAAEIRQARDAAERAAIESVVQETARYGVIGRLKRRAKDQPGGSLRDDMPDLES